MLTYITVSCFQNQEKIPADQEVKPAAEAAVAEGATPLTLTSQTSSLCVQTCRRQSAIPREQLHALRPANMEENHQRSLLLKGEPLP